jgi:alpha-amylase
MSERNGVIFQAFQWYSAGDGTFWKKLGSRSKDLANAGFSSLWLPPAYKGLSGVNDVGYGVYDLYDLGEFDQKGSVRTKYGTKKEYTAAIKALKNAGLDIYPDIVLNHRMGGDEAENFNATPFDSRNRTFPSAPLREIQSFTGFTFPARKKAYSEFHWHWHHFDAVDYDELKPNGNSTIYLVEGHQFDDQVSLENGNYAYLMGCDVDFQNAEVREEMIRWGKWYLDITGADGFRLDAIKHISAWFFPDWIREMEKYAAKDLFVVGEYWNCDITALTWYIEAVQQKISVFDVPLHFNFYNASRMGRNYDMRKLLDGTLMKHAPVHAVTFVENHDSQPLQSLESTVEPWFKPLAYAFILLRAEGYPCVFAADYDGASYEDKGHDGNRYKIEMLAHRRIIDILLSCRKNNAHGPQYNYFDHPNTIGWTRLGNEEHPKAMAVIMGNGDPGFKWMETGRNNTVFADATGTIREKVTTNDSGWGEFRCGSGSVSVWIET